MRHHIEKGKMPLLVIDGKPTRYDEMLLKTPFVGPEDFILGFIENPCGELYVTRKGVERTFHPSFAGGVRMERRRSGRPLICVTTEEAAE